MSAKYDENVQTPRSKRAARKDVDYSDSFHRSTRKPVTDINPFHSLNTQPINTLAHPTKARPKKASACLKADEFGKTNKIEFNYSSEMTQPTLVVKEVFIEGTDIIFTQIHLG